MDGLRLSTFSANFYFRVNSSFNHNYAFSHFIYARSIFPGAIEKQKLVYILNRDAAARLTISSPLEAHKANTLVYHVVGVDVGFENPMFACLEMDYEVRVILLVHYLLAGGPGSELSSQGDFCMTKIMHLW